MTALETLFQQSLSTHSISIVGIAFLGGVVSSFLPCTLGMLPVMVGYVGGYAGNSKKEVLFQVLLFIIGIAAVMTALGVAASLLGMTFGSFIGPIWYYAIGTLAIVIGLQLLGVFHIPLPQFVSKLPDSKQGKILTPLLLGLAFGIAASPCGTPFLFGILGFIANEHNLFLGAASLFAYSLGQGLLLLIVGLSTGLLKYMSLFRKIGSTLNNASAYFFILAGCITIAQGLGIWADILLFLHLI